MFKVVSVIDHKSILVDYTGSTAGLPNIDDESTADSYGNLYKFTSVRLNSMDNVNDLIHYDNWKDTPDVWKRRFPNEVQESYEELWEKEGYTEEFKAGPPPPKRPGE